MQRSMLVIVAACALLACKKEEPPPPDPPQVLGATVTCGDASGEDVQVVEEVGVEIVDPDRDLVTSSIFATVNGVPMKEIADDDADNVFTWRPPSSWDPPMACRGAFTIIAEVEDATDLHVKETIVVEK